MSRKRIENAIPPTPEELGVKLPEIPVEQAPIDLNIQDAVEVFEDDEFGSVVKEPTSDPDPVKDELQPKRPMTEAEAYEANKVVSADRSYISVVGYPVLFEGSAAIITKVWERGLVNLTVFHDGSPVPDLKTSVPYGEGPNTWKEIN